MPTGYTAIFSEKDVSFDEYALRCARAMGACVSMRDEPMDAQIIIQVPDESGYYRKNIHALRMRIFRLSKAKPNQLRAAMLRELSATAQFSKECRKKDRNLELRYRAMLEKVAAWTPPTPDHCKFKEFMTEQLESSLRHDCGMEDYYDKSDAQVLADLCMTPEEWREKKLKELRKDLSYHVRSLMEERNRAAMSNAWIQNLKDSLFTN